MRGIVSQLYPTKVVLWAFGFAVAAFPVLYILGFLGVEWVTYEWLPNLVPLAIAALIALVALAVAITRAHLHIRRSDQVDRAVETLIDMCGKLVLADRNHAPKVWGPDEIGVWFEEWKVQFEEVQSGISRLKETLSEEEVDAILEATLAPSSEVRLGGVNGEHYLLQDKLNGQAKAMTEIRDKYREYAGRGRLGN